ncbi:leucyl aminopeptidase [Stomatohabitans albus]
MDQSIPNLVSTSDDPLKAGTDVLIIPVGGPESRGAIYDSVNAACDAELDKTLDALGFTKATANTVTQTLVHDMVIMLVGLGDQPDLEAYRMAVGSAIQQVPEGKRVAVAAGDEPVIAGAIAEGAVLGAYHFDRYRNVEQERLDEIVIVTKASAAVERADVMATATALARNLVNTPPANKRPEDLADTIAGLLKDNNVSVTIRDQAWLEAHDGNGLLAVCRGSEHEPRLVELDYNPAGAERHVVLVGKGITFDTGGINLKPSQGMADMKSDMAGTAVVTAVMSALAALDVKVRVTGFCTIAENMPSGTAQRPSDVITMMNGKTVEVGNTDAEGRLVMADGLVLGSRMKPDVIIDLATLTGAQIVVAGMEIACVMGTADVAMDEFEEAAETEGEEYIRLPLPKRYATGLKSNIADMNNISGAGFGAGTIMAGMFLAEFVEEDTPWFHVDFAGPSFRDSVSGYLSPGGTGFGVRSLLAWLETGNIPPRA